MPDDVGIKRAPFQWKEKEDSFLPKMRQKQKHSDTVDDQTMEFTSLRSRMGQTQPPGALSLYSHNISKLQNSVNSYFCS